MTRIIQKIILSLLVATFLFAPSFAFADPVTEKAAECPKDGEGYCLLEPIFADQVNVRVTMFEYLSRIYKVFFITCGILATLILIWGGFQYMTSEIPGMKGKGIAQMQNAIWGLLLAVFSYLILYTINPALLNVNFELRPIPGIDAGRYSTSTTPGPIDPGNTGATIDLVAENQVRSQLVGVTVKKTCSYIGEPNCVLVMGLPQSAISGVTQLARDCFILSCKPYISGGTEWWGHATHGPGKPNVDLSFANSGSTLSNYIRTNGQVVENNMSCGEKNRPTYRLKGATYVDERDHWHVCY